jgi:hypothetical protein
MILCEGNYPRSSEITIVGILVTVGIFEVPNWDIYYPTCVGSLEGSGMA